MRIARLLGNRVIIVDDFYDDPLLIRNRILAQATWDFTKRAYSGFNSLERFEQDYARETISNIMGVEIQLQNNQLFGVARITPEGNYDRGYIHIDRLDWNGIVYLNPEGLYPESNGTCIWQHKETGVLECSKDLDEVRKTFKTFDKTVGGSVEETRDTSKWDLVLKIDGKFNRLALINAKLWHSAEPMNGFGSTKEDCRLVQIFSFSL